MTQRQLESAVADATGEPLGLVHDLGFSLVTPGRDDLDPENLILAVVCPACRRAVPYPGATRDGSLPLAECLACDRCFELTPAAIFPTTSGARRDVTHVPKTRSAAIAMTRPEVLKRT